MKTAFIFLSVSLAALAAPTTQLSDDPPHDRRRLKAHPHALSNDAYVKPTLARRSPDCINLGETNQKKFKTICIASSNLRSEITLDYDFCVAKGGNTCELEDGTLVEDVCFDKQCLGLSNRRDLPEAMPLKRTENCVPLRTLNIDKVDISCIVSADEDISNVPFGASCEHVVKFSEESGNIPTDDCDFDSGIDSVMHNVCISTDEGCTKTGTPIP